MSPTGTLRIKDLAFAVADGTLEATLLPSGEIDWYLNVETEPAEFFGETWQPRAYIEQFRSRPWSMDDFLAHPIRIDDALEFSESRFLPGGPLCCLYVFEHECINQIVVQLKRHSGNRVQMHWTGRCDVGWNEDYRDDLPFEVDAVIDFLGFAVPEETEEEAKTAAKYFDLTGFRFQTAEGRSGGFYIPVADRW